MTTEQQWLGNEPLSAALEDAEGRALVEAILERRRQANAYEKFLQMMVWGDYSEDAEGWVIPRQEPDHWKSVRMTMVSGRGHGKNAALEGYRRARDAMDEYPGFLTELTRDPHQDVRDLVVRTPWMEPSTVPDVAFVRWACNPGKVAR